MGERFTARTEDECELCGVVINPGEDAGYVDDDVYCADCWEMAR